MLGTSNEDAGFDLGTSTGALGAVAQRAVDTLPYLARLRIVRAWAGLRIMSPDDYPVYDQSPRFPGAFAVACHSGVTLAAVHVLRVARHIVAGRIPAVSRVRQVQRNGHAMNFSRTQLGSMQWIQGFTRGP